LWLLNPKQVLAASPGEPESGRSTVPDSGNFPLADPVLDITGQILIDLWGTSASCSALYPSVDNFGVHEESTIYTFNSLTVMFIDSSYLLNS
jgi:hypothetical protein